MGDFGVSKKIENSLTETNSGRIGNLYYMDYDHISGKCRGQECWKRDIWSLGLMLYTLLTGKTIYYSTIEINCERLATEM